MFIEKELGYKRHWINIDSDIISEQSYLYTKYDIDQETIEYALDKNERAHMDYNRENGTITFIYNVLALEKDKEYYETIPLTFIVQDTRLVTISNEDNAYVISKMQDYVDNHEDLSIYKLLFAGLEMISNAYYPVIERLDQQKDEVEIGQEIALDDLAGRFLRRVLRYVDKSLLDTPGDLAAAESGRLRRADPFLFVFHVKRFLIFSCFLCLYYSVRKSENQGKKY